MFTARQIDEYRQRGYFIAREVLSSADVAAFRDEVHEMCRRGGDGEIAQNTNFRGVKKMNTSSDRQLN